MTFREFMTIRIKSIMIHVDFGLLSFHNQDSWSVPGISSFRILCRKRVAAPSPVPGDGKLQECQEELL